MRPAGKIAMACAAGEERRGQSRAGSGTPCLMSPVHAIRLCACLRAAASLRTRIIYVGTHHLQCAMRALHSGQSRDPSASSVCAMLLRRGADVTWGRGQESCPVSSVCRREAKLRLPLR